MEAAVAAAAAAAAATGGAGGVGTTSGVSGGKSGFFHGPVYFVPPSPDSPSEQISKVPLSSSDSASTLSFIVKCPIFKPL